ncbi:MAG TPA: hypothetical protein VHH34_12575 [Pseudonocardiaceae bacterium]|nr:hypothetical protein [Pseudonocardiaceae bacterium]
MTNVYLRAYPGEQVKVVYNLHDVDPVFNDPLCNTSKTVNISHQNFGAGQTYGFTVLNLVIEENRCKATFPVKGEPMYQ